MYELKEFLWIELINREIIVFKLNTARMRMASPVRHDVGRTVRRLYSQASGLALSFSVLAS